MRGGAHKIVKRARSFLLVGVVAHVENSSKLLRTSMFITIVLCYVSLCVVNRYYENHMIIYVMSKTRKLEWIDWGNCIDPAICGLISNKGPLLSNNCDTVYEEAILLKHLKKTVCIYRCGSMNSCAYYSSFMYTKYFCNVLTVVFFHKSCHKCFTRSGPFLQIRSHIYTLGGGYLMFCCL